MNNNTNVIIFSCNRACQLDACISSFLFNCEEPDKAEISVIYKSTNESFEKGYEKLKEKFIDKNIDWVKENNFRRQTTEKIISSKCSFTMFLVDDIIFINKFSFSDQNFSLLHTNNMLLSISLRLHKGANHCFATDNAQEIPKFVKGNVWSWKNSEGDWGYPMSVDGNIFKTSLMKQIIDKVNFRNPNTFEAAMASAANILQLPEYLCCYTDAPKLINIPANRVQNSYNNRISDGYTAEELNQFYLAGKVIDIKNYQNAISNTVHVPAEIKFIE